LYLIPIQQAHGNSEERIEYAKSNGNDGGNIAWRFSTPRAKRGEQGAARAGRQIGFKVERPRR
jgi:hypothetical protein